MRDKLLHKPQFITFNLRHSGYHWYGHAAILIKGLRIVPSMELHASRQKPWNKGDRFSYGIRSIHRLVLQNLVESYGHPMTFPVTSAPDNKSHSIPAVVVPLIYHSLQPQRSLCSISARKRGLPRDCMIDPCLCRPVRLSSPNPADCHFCSVHWSPGLISLQPTARYPVSSLLSCSALKCRKSGW